MYVVRLRCIQSSRKVCLQFKLGKFFNTIKLYIMGTVFFSAMSFRLVMYQYQNVFDGEEKVLSNIWYELWTILEF